jgi:hypothetical protein
VRCKTASRINKGEGVFYERTTFWRRHAVHAAVSARYEIYKEELNGIHDGKTDAAISAFEERTEKNCSGRSSDGSGIAEP